MSETAQTTQTAALPGVKWYRRKQSVVPGVTWQGGNYDEIRAFALAPDGGECFRWRNRGLQVWNDQEQTWFSVPDGHTVIRGALGEYYPVSPEALARTYGPADGTGSGQVSPDLTCAHCAPASGDLLDDFLFERGQVVTLRAVLGEVFRCIAAGDPSLLDDEQVAEWRERAGMEES